ncbi:hypothetical protein CDAR_230781 [Caerostris darwini]|uniref:Uncharacterized protein n=1 Tax=Caerostris darwini TaxID=1538125 RepID=A0AAV4S4R3_9ARAC|nr:hypothetical protein CDAR_230781 [Caerostris darwini]
MYGFHQVNCNRHPPLPLEPLPFQKKVPKVWPRQRKLSHLCIESRCIRDRAQSGFIGQIMDGIATSAVELFLKLGSSRLILRLSTDVQRDTISLTDLAQLTKRENCPLSILTMWSLQKRLA